MKKTVKLTGKELKRMISESVKESMNRILTELDWRTYANAEKDARTQLRDKMKSGASFEDLRNDKDFLKRARQANSFGNQAVNASRDKFRFMNDDENEFYTTIGPDSTYYANAENDSWEGRPMTLDKDGKTRMLGLSCPKNVNVTPQRYFGYDDDKIDKWNKFSKEISDYNKGKSKYIKGKGWK